MTVAESWDVEKPTIFFKVINKHNNPICADRTVINVNVFAVRIV